MTISNPHEKGTMAHQSFNTYVLWARHLSNAQLAVKINDLRNEAENFMRHSAASMAQLDFQANTYQAVLDARNEGAKQ